MSVNTIVYIDNNRSGNKEDVVNNINYNKNIFLLVGVKGDDKDIVD